MVMWPPEFLFVPLALDDLLAAEAVFISSSEESSEAIGEDKNTNSVHFALTDMFDKVKIF